MSWSTYLVLALVALTVAYFLWARLSAYAVKGKSVEPLYSALPGLTAHYDRAVIYCYSKHCAPCRRLAPDIERLCEQYPNLFRLDVTQHPRESRAAGIRVTPTTLLIERGKVLKALLGGGVIPTIEVFLQRP